MFDAKGSKGNMTCGGTPTLPLAILAPLQAVRAALDKGKRSRSGHAGTVLRVIQPNKVYDATVIDTPSSKSRLK